MVRVEHARAAGHEVADHLLALLPDGAPERGVALPVPQLGVSAVVEQVAHAVQLAGAGRADQRSLPPVTCHVSRDMCYEVTGSCHDHLLALSTLNMLMFLATVFCFIISLHSMLSPLIC